MLARVFWPSGERMNATITAREAVRTVHGVDYVTLDTADGPLDVAVVLGEQYQDSGQPRVEVLTGLADGDKVVVP